MAFAAQHTVEDLQAFTAQWVPHPQWVRVDDVDIPADKIDEAGRLLTEQLGPEGVKLVGGTKWWQWRKPEAPLAAEWIEMKSDYSARKKADGACKRVLYSWRCLLLRLRGRTSLPAATACPEAPG
jgi:hypothetical protein